MFGELSLFFFHQPALHSPFLLTIVRQMLDITIAASVMAASKDLH